MKTKTTTVIITIRGASQANFVCINKHTRRCNIWNLVGPHPQTCRSPDPCFLWRTNNALQALIFFVLYSCTARRALIIFLLHFILIKMMIAWALFSIFSSAKIFDETGKEHPEAFSLIQISTQLILLFFIFNSHLSSHQSEGIVLFALFKFCIQIPIITTDSERICTVYTFTTYSHTVEALTYCNFMGIRGIHFFSFFWCIAPRSNLINTNQHNNWIAEKKRKKCVLGNLPSVISSIVQSCVPAFILFVPFTSSILSCSYTVYTTENASFCEKEITLK